MSAGESCYAWTCRISSLLFQRQGFAPCFELPAIRNLSPVCWAAFARMRFRPPTWNQFQLDAGADQRREAAWLYGRRHLPQGAPTSPALANVCAWRIDRRLAGLAEAAGADYTRYADDLAFSGDHRSNRAWIDSLCMLPQFFLKKAFARTTARPASCGVEYGSTSPAWWPTTA